MEPEGSLPHLHVLATCPYPEPDRSSPYPHIPLPEQKISPSPRLSLWMVRDMICFYGEKLLATHPTPKAEDHPLSSVRDCLFNIYAATLHTGGRSSIRKLRTRHGVVTETHLSRIVSTLV